MPDLIDCCLDFFFVLLVQGASSLVKKEDLWFFDKGSCDSNSLLLPARELATGIANICVDAVSTHLLIDEIPGIRRFESLNNILISCIRISI